MKNNVIGFLIFMLLTPMGFAAAEADDPTWSDELLNLAHRISAEKNLLEVPEGSTIEGELTALERDIKELEAKGWRKLPALFGPGGGTVITETETSEAWAAARLQDIKAGAYIRREILRRELEAPLFLGIPLGEESNEPEGGYKTTATIADGLVTFVVEDERRAYTMAGRFGEMGYQSVQQAKLKPQYRAELDQKLLNMGLDKPLADLSLMQGIRRIEIEVEYQSIDSRWTELSQLFFRLMDQAYEGFSKSKVDCLSVIQSAVALK